MNKIVQILNRAQNKKETEAIVYSNYKKSLSQWIDDEVQQYNQTNRQSAFYGLDETGINSLLRLCDSDQSEYRYFFFNGSDHDRFLKIRKEDSVYSDLLDKWLVAVEPDLYRKCMNNKQSYLLNNSCTIICKESAKKITSEILSQFKPFFLGSRLQNSSLNIIHKYIFFLFDKPRSAAGFRKLQAELSNQMEYEFESLLEISKALKVYYFGINTGLDNDTDLFMGSLLEGDKKSFTGMQPLLKYTESDSRRMAEKKRFLLAMFLFWVDSSSIDRSLLAFFISEIDSKHSFSFSKSPDSVATSLHLAATNRIYRTNYIGMNLFIHYANFLSGLGNYSWSRNSFRLVSYEWKELSNKTPELIINEKIHQLLNGYEPPEPLGKILTKHIPLEMKTIRMIIMEPDVDKSFSVLLFSPEESALIAKALLRERSTEFWPMNNYPINKIINWTYNSDICLHYSCWFTPNDFKQIKNKISSYSVNTNCGKQRLLKVESVGNAIDNRLLELILTAKATRSHSSYDSDLMENHVIYVKQLTRPDLEEILFYSEYNTTEEK